MIIVFNFSRVIDMEFVKLMFYAELLCFNEVYCVKIVVKLLFLINYL